MPKLFKADRTYPLPADAEIVTKKDKPHVRILERGKPTLYPLTKNGTHYLKPSAKWCAEVRHADGCRRKIYFSTRRDASEMMLAELLKTIELQKAGVVDRFAVQRKRPLAEHINDWATSLKANGRSDVYVTLKTKRAKDIAEACSFTFSADIQAEAVEQFLHDLRTVQGRSIQTANDWLQAFKQLIRWMVANQRLDRDPLTRLKAGNVRLDSRHRRGELTSEEVTKLLEASTTQAPFRGINGTDRVLLYKVALGTGFRVTELASLTPEQFNLDATPPMVVLQPGNTKNRQGATQPIAQWLADELKTFFSDRLPSAKLWPGTWAEKGAKMIYRDLEAAGIPREVETADGTEIRDFHSLRNAYISRVIRSGADVKQAMTLARHSDPKLTTARYARAKLHDLGSVVEALPGNQRVAKRVADSGEVRGSMSTDENFNATESAHRETPKPLVNKGFDDGLGCLKRGEEGEPTRGFEPRTYALRKHCSTTELSRLLINKIAASSPFGKMKRSVQWSVPLLGRFMISLSMG